MTTCIHLWNIDVSHNGIVYAKCRKCGEEKYYPSVVVNTSRFKTSYVNKKANLQVQSKFQ